ncbi:hypothetical protein [Rhizobium sp. AAP43]|nr:hypothetical protein [Rhizobium sp. AAP43]
MVKITSNYTMSLSKAELDMLDGLLQAGGKAAFYSAAYSGK